MLHQLCHQPLHILHHVPGIQGSGNIIKTLTLKHKAFFHKSHICEVYCIIFGSISIYNVKLLSIIFYLVLFCTILFHSVIFCSFPFDYPLILLFFYNMFYSHIQKNLLDAELVMVIYQLYL